MKRQSGSEGLIMQIEISRRKSTYVDMYEMRKNV